MRDRSRGHFYGHRSGLYTHRAGTQRFRRVSPAIRAENEEKITAVAEGNDSEVTPRAYVPSGRLIRSCAGQEIYFADGDPLEKCEFRLRGSPVYDVKR